MERRSLSPWQLIRPQERVSLRQQVALVLQNSNYQLFTPSVEDEIAFGLKNMGLREEALHKRLEELLTRYNLAELRHKPPHELSEGQKKWVALVAVLATDPEVLILDEPTAALDALYTERVLDLLEQLHLAGKTIISPPTTWSWPAASPIEYYSWRQAN